MMVVGVGVVAAAAVAAAAVSSWSFVYQHLLVCFRDGWLHFLSVMMGGWLRWRDGLFLILHYAIIFLCPQKQCKGKTAKRRNEVTVKSSPICKVRQSFCLPANMTIEWDKRAKQVSPAERVRVLVLCHFSVLCWQFSWAGCREGIGDVLWVVGVLKFYFSSQLVRLL